MKKFLKTFLEAFRGDEQEFTTGSMNRAIFLLAVPMVLEMAGEALFALADSFWISKISGGEAVRADALTTIGLAESVMMLVYSLAFGIGAAATAMVARRIGEKNLEGAATASIQAIIFGVAISMAIGIASWFYAGDILHLMGASESVVLLGSDYTRLMFGFNLVIMLLFVLNGIFRGAGNAAIAMKSLWVANLINIVLDPCLIFGWGFFPELGLTGAAIATIIGRSIGVIFQLYILFNGTSLIKLSLKNARPNFKIINQVIRLASGTTGQFLIGSASWIVLMKIVAEFGSSVVAGYVISIRLLIFTILPAWGIANAASTLVGQNLGAKQPERAEKSVWLAAKYNMYFMLSVSIIYGIFSPQIIGIFSTESVVLESGVLSMRIMCLSYLFFAYGMVISQAFNGAGDTFTPTIINFISFWLIEIPLAWLLAKTLGWGPAGVYWSIAVSETILALLSIYQFRKGYWKKVEI